ncbi:MAG: hypothetical protein CMO44_10170 [Verrucomicrobiales bacterium]|nr:hypothetical protein [Verrucomicrobiales bacterium]
MEVGRYMLENPYTTTHKDYFPNDCESKTPPFGKWKLLQRPIVGDHIHLLYKIKLKNRYIIFHDRNLTQTIAYESPPICPAAVSYAYKKQFYHTGVHSHCDSSPTNAGIIHIHPWSAPIKLRVEGREVTLGMFFESVGIEHSTKGLGFLIHGEYYKLKMEYFVHASIHTATFRSSKGDEIENLWLPDCHGAVLLWDSSSEKPEITKEDIEFMNTFSCYPENYPSRVSLK